MVQILDFGREPVTVRAEDEIYDGLFLAWRKKLLLDRFLPTCPSSVIAMPLGSVGKGERAHTGVALCSSSLTGFSRRYSHPGRSRQDTVNLLSTASVTLVHTHPSPYLPEAMS